MPIVPRDRKGKLRFFQAHRDVWLSQGESIGLDAETLAAFDADLAAAEQAFGEQQAHLQSARTATAKWNSALKRLDRRGSLMLLRIKNAAKSEGVGVYLRAWVDAPARPSRLRPPGTPGGFQYKLLPSSALELRWTCRIPRGSKGTQYLIHRSIDGGKFVYLKQAGKRRFIDRTLPAGAARVIYEITASRPTGQGEAARFNVNLGVSGDVQGDAALNGAA